MSPIPSSLPGRPALASPYTGPERRRFGAAARRDDLLPGERALLAAPPAVEAASLQSERSRVVDEVQEAVCAALCGDAPLFDLLRERVGLRCVRHPLLGEAAAAEIDRLLAVDIVQRHFLACDKRRRLQRELTALAGRLRAAPAGV
ncbi:MAG: hypothetical protein EKK53_13475 [Burkholderiales bacterium]|nr:MAG: hypothetical protein EKK53_13475 [Burkholderiales bacterium]